MQNETLKRIMVEQHARFYKPEGRHPNIKAKGYAKATVEEMWNLYPGEGEKDKENCARVKSIIANAQYVLNKVKKLLPHGELALLPHMGCLSTALCLFT